jgi:lipoprotein-anchoring transpeptidase ErfK/SrfK
MITQAKVRLAQEKQKEAERKKEKQKKLAKKKKIKKTKKQHITAHIDISKQRMKVFKGKKLLYVWRVSTARKGYKTATGEYKVQRIKKMHYSSLYHNSPMPYTIFYHGNYAIHGTRSVSKLGRPASHGCVRLHTKNAKKLYTLVNKNGKNNMSIKIVR